MIKKCLKVLLFLGAIALAFGCTEKLYNLVKGDFAGELNVFKSSLGGRWAECEQALKAQFTCAEDFFKGKGCDYIEEFNNLKRDVFLNHMTAYNEASLYNEEYYYPDYDAPENEKILKIINERDKYCFKEVQQMSVCNDQNNNSQMGLLSSAIKATNSRLNKQMDKNLDNHCEG